MNRKEGQKKEKKKKQILEIIQFTKTCPLPPAFLHLFPDGLIVFFIPNRKLQNCAENDSIYTVHPRVTPS